MGIAPCLFYQQLWRLIGSAEKEARQRQVPAAVVDEVFRYGADIGFVVEQHPRLERCMERARQLIGDCRQLGGSPATGTLIFADELSGARGRFQRWWHAPAGGLWCCLILADTLTPAFARLLPLAAGIACCELARSYGLAARVRWINDVLVQNRKVAGVLVETVTTPGGGERFFLVGIGINLNNDRFPREIMGSAAALASFVGGRGLDRQEAMLRLAAKLAWNVGLLFRDEAVFLAQESEAEALLLRSWKDLSDTCGRRVAFGVDLQKETLFEATAVDMEADGGLRLLLDDGTSVVERSGEIVYLDVQ